MQKEILRNPVFFVSAALIVFIVIAGAAAPSRFGDIAANLFQLTTNAFGWFYLLSVTLLIVFLLWLALSKYGRLRLGGEGERPEFPFFTWVGMLFSAGFGVGLVFWGVAEPMSHFFTPPYSGVEAQTEEAARIAMGYSFFHWGISQWSVFAIVGLVIAFLQFRRQKNGLISTALEPVIGNKPAVKNAIDSLAVIATVMGVATSIGLGVLQANGGMNAVFGTGQGFGIQVVIIGSARRIYNASAGWRMRPARTRRRSSGRVRLRIGGPK